MMSYAEIYAEQFNNVVDVRAAESELPSLEIPAYTWLLHDDDLSAEGTNLVGLLEDLGMTVSDNATTADEIAVTIEAVYRTDQVDAQGEYTQIAPVGADADVYDVTETGRYLVYVNVTDRFGNVFVDQIALVVID